MRSRNRLATSVTLTELNNKINATYLEGRSSRIKFHTAGWTKKGLRNVDTQQQFPEVL